MRGPNGEESPHYGDIKDNFILRLEVEAPIAELSAIGAGRVPYLGDRTGFFMNSAYYPALACWTHASLWLTKRRHLLGAGASRERIEVGNPEYRAWLQPYPRIAPRVSKRELASYPVGES
jgi:hypothetical protein